MEDCPQYSLASFHEFLKFRRVTIKIKESRTSSNERTSSLRLARELLFARIQAEIDGTVPEDSGDASDRDSEERIIIPEFHRLISSRRLNANPDFFYNPSQDTGEKYRYTGAKEVLGDRRYSNNTETNSRCTERLFLDSIREIKTAKEIWEQNDDLTISETTAVPPHDINNPDANNGGVYGAEIPGLSVISYRDPMYLLELPPGEKFRDSLQLHGKCSFSLTGIENSRKGKGNLSCLISGGDGPDILAVAHMSEILIYEFDETSNGVNKTPSLRFETRPDFTTNGHVQNSTWPFYPHTINSLKSHSDWVNGPICAACLDDGRVLLWDKSAILNAMSKSKSQSSIKLSATYKVGVNSSAWGIDFMTKSESSDGNHHIMCVSANTATISLFYFDKSSQDFSSVESHKLSHNIPEVSFIDYMVRGENHLALLSCTTIQEEVVVFKIYFDMKKPNNGKNEKLQVTFQPPEVVRRTQLDGDGWTCKPIHARYFKKVQSLRAMTGDPNINDMNESAGILCESKILAAEGKNSPLNSLGIASYWQYFETPMLHPSLTPTELDTSAKCQCVNEEHQRIHEAYKLLCTREEEKSDVFKGLEDVFLAVSSNKSLYLYRADTLFCTAATRSAFTLDGIPYDEEFQWYDRISISHVVPELSCWIAVTQIGLVTIMRLCEYRGVYGMRQEHLFPNALILSEFEDAKRTVIGMSLRNLSVSAEIPRFFLYLIYSDGLTLTYELRTKMDSNLGIIEF